LLGISNNKAHSLKERVYVYSLVSISFCSLKETKFLSLLLSSIVQGFIISVARCRYLSMKCVEAKSHQDCFSFFLFFFFLLFRHSVTFGAVVFFATSIVGLITFWIHCGAQRQILLISKAVIWFPSTQSPLLNKK